ncbi:MAG TPA: hypothetical protein PLO05_00890 [Bacteroidales bacterium]|jgi:hypothetical protein|nr:hypothetical protein [Bacteroidales bacterium]MDD4234589.1 hypothetical protein [Bacteroidales bacterium]MDY0160983.1 hypothetical protein [Bacteroidales bacterium]HXK80697.1 hypothetical protein [Bacteroidales bacterium]
MELHEIIQLLSISIVVTGIFLRTRKQRTLVIILGLVGLMFGFYMLPNMGGIIFSFVILCYVIIKYYISRKKISQINIIEVTQDDNYLNKFLHYYKKELYNFFPLYEQSYNDRVFFLIREMNVAGILIVKINGSEMIIELDFIKPEYRDFEIGNYIYNRNTGYFKKLGVSKILAKSFHKKHSKYLIRMGFKQTLINEQLFFVKNID